ncbi:hypothetical protein SSX86_021543 [Deinandra increscens subsp. villosa]|uniref:non-specific serine/threonine protein kinase n=1 Tax=Deinandra increscens subsp. villosa TaxID=3103831 RepID=A0AAP0GUA9_9ASTR
MTLAKSLLPNCFKIKDLAMKQKKPKSCRRKSSSADHNSSSSSSSLFPSRISFNTDLSSSTLSEDISNSLAGSNLHVFTLAELKLITHSFSSSNFLGEGGFGPVHKGFIDDKLKPGLKAQPVAVKLLDLEGLQGHREWLTEVIFLGELRHPHLVKLIGYCCEDEHRVLVYEYMPRGSLENQLFRRFSVSLPWSIRMKIALGVAKGLAFLHEAKKPVIYRDFKASNILLDSVRTISKLNYPTLDLPRMVLREMTRMFPPELWAHTVTPLLSHLTAASDVYSFGVVLLELVTGRKSLDKSRPNREQNLADWARPQLKCPRKLSRIMDPRLEGMYSESGAEKAAELAYHCLSHRPKARPNMSTVVKTLESLQDDFNEQVQVVYTAPKEDGQRRQRHAGTTKSPLSRH